MASTLHTLESPSQNPNDMQVASEQLKQFRQQLYSSLAYRGDTIMDLLDALSSSKPVTMGHQYSALVLFPEKVQASAPLWVVPLSLRRVTTQETKGNVGVQHTQIHNAILFSRSLRG